MCSKCGSENSDHQSHCFQCEPTHQRCEIDGMLLTAEEVEYFVMNPYWDHRFLCRQHRPFLNEKTRTEAGWTGHAKDTADRRFHLGATGLPLCRHDEIPLCQNAVRV